MKKRGYTLIELLVTLGIMSIVLGIGLVKFNVVEKIKADSEIQTMFNDINYAKEKAMISGKPYKLLLYKDSYEIRPANSLNHIIYRKLDYTKINNGNTKTPIEITYYPTGSVDNAGKILITSMYANQEKIDKLVIGVAGGFTRIDEN